MKNLKSKYDIVLFDLDGTITESSEGIKKGLEYTLEKLNMKYDGLDDYSLYIGPPLMDTFKNLFKLNQEEAEQAYKYYFEYYNEKGKFQCVLYNGILDVIKDVKASGAKTAVCTSKYEPFAIEIIEHMKMGNLFNAICGSNKEGTRRKKEDLIPYALNKVNKKDKESVVLIGDTKFDAEGAKITNIDFVGALYGYGVKTEMEKENGKNFANSPEDIRQFIFK